MFFSRNIIRDKKTFVNLKNKQKSLFFEINPKKFQIMQSPVHGFKFLKNVYYFNMIYVEMFSIEMVGK